MKLESENKNVPTGLEGYCVGGLRGRLRGP